MSAQRSSGTRTAIIFAAVAGIVLVLLVAAVFLGDQQAGSEFGEPTLAGSPLPPMPSTARLDTSAAGLTYPQIAGESFDGSEVTITNDGRAKAIVFLAHWCPHCQVEVPKIQEWLDNGGSVDGVDLYSVVTAIDSTKPNYPPSAWLEREHWTVPVIRDDQSGIAHRAYGSGGFPYWVFTNSDGTVALRAAGEVEISEFVSILESLE